MGAAATLLREEARVPNLAAIVPKRNLPARRKTARPFKSVSRYFACNEIKY